jgi:hypothetical protein
MIKNRWLLRDEPDSALSNFPLHFYKSWGITPVEVKGQTIER